MNRVEWNLPANTREQALFAAFLLAFVFFFVHILYHPQTERLEKIQKKTASLELEKKALSKLNVLSPGKIKPLSHRKDVKMKVLSGDIGSPHENVSTLSTRLTESDFRRGVPTQTLSYAPAIKEKGYERTDFTMKLRGSFAEILHYLEKMEEFPALFSLGGVTIQDVEGQPQEVEAEIMGHFFKIEKTNPNQAPVAPPVTAAAGGKS